MTLYKDSSKKSYQQLKTFYPYNEYDPKVLQSILVAIVFID